MKSDYCLCTQQPCSHCMVAFSNHAVPGRYQYRHEDLPPTTVAGGSTEPARPMRMHYFTQQTDGQNFLVWGLTSAILIHVSELVFGAPPEFEKDGPLQTPKPAPRL